MEIRLGKIALFFSTVLLALVNTSFSQVKKVKDVKGVATIVNISPEQARIKAIEAAKVESLRLAGVEEWVQSFDYLDTREINNKLDEFFHSVTAVQTMGNIISWELVSEEKKLDSFNNLSYVVTINADVRIYKTKQDPEFQLTISGINSVYKNEENLTFQVLPHKEGYLNIFIIDQSDNVTLLFPNQHEQVNKLAEGVSCKFPISQHFKYEIYTELKEEVNYIFVLFTRKNIPHHVADFTSFIEYVYQIEPHDRFVAMEKILIAR